MSTTKTSTRLLAMLAALALAIGLTLTAAPPAHANAATGDPFADGWALQGHSLDAGVFVRGDGDFAFDIYSAAFTLDSGSDLVGGDWEEGHAIVGLGGVIDPDDDNPNLTHSVRIVSKFSAGHDTWSVGGTGSFSGAGGEGALLLATRAPLRPSGNTEHLNPFAGYSSSRVPTALDPGDIHQIPIFQRVEGGSVNSNAGAEAGKFIYLSDGPDYTDGSSGETAQLLSSWQVFVNVSLLDDPTIPVPEVGDNVVQALQRSTGVSTDGIGTIEALAPPLPDNPQTKDDCKNGGWQGDGPDWEGDGFRNQGQCIRFVNTA